MYPVLAERIFVSWVQNRVMAAAPFRNIEHLQTFIATKPTTNYDILYLPPIPYRPIYATHALLCSYIAMSLKEASPL
jgi:hypothetical protein